MRVVAIAKNSPISKFVAGDSIVLKPTNSNTRVVAGMIVRVVDINVYLVHWMLDDIMVTHTQEFIDANCVKADAPEAAWWQL